MADQALTIRIGGQLTAGPSFRAAGALVRQLAQQGQAAQASVQRAGAQASASVRAVGTAAVIAGRGMRAFGAAAAASLASVQRGAGRVQAALSRAGSVLSRVGSMAAGPLALGLGASAAAAGLLAKAGVDMNVTLDGARVALTRMTGSAGSAARLIAELRQEALTSSLTFKDMLPVAQSLVAVLGPGRLGQVVPIMRAFGDAATALQLPADSLDRALLGFRQLVSRPFAQQEELNQINENLPGANVGSILRRAFGTADTEALQQAGVTGQQVGDAIVRGLQQSFGGSQRALGGTIPLLLSGIQDTLNDVSGSLTRGLTRSVTRALQNVLGAFNALGSSGVGQRIMAGLTAAFDALGRVLERVSEQGQGFLNWLSQIVNRENVILFLSNVLGLLQTIGETVAGALGVNLAKAFDPQHIMGFFDALGQGVTALIRGAFGIARVWDEVRSIVGEFFTDLNDRVRDTVQDMLLAFGGMFAGLNAQISGAVVAMLTAIRSVVQALNLVTFGLFTDAFLSISREIGAQSSRQVSSEIIQEQFGMAAGNAQAARAHRDAARRFANPNRGLPAGQRIAAAFQGNAGSRAAEDRFFAAFERNRTAIGRFLFGQSAAPPPAPPVGGGIARQAPSVQTQRLVGGPRAQASQGDPFAPVRLSDGRVISRVAAVQLGLLSPSLPPPGGGSGGPEFSGARAVQTGPDAVQIVLNFQGVQSPEQLRQIVLQVLDREARRAFAGPGG